MNAHLTGLISLLLNMSNILGSTIYEDVYWGPGEQPYSIDESIRPFKIIFDNEMIVDLKMRLNNTRKLQPSMKNTGWSYGTNSEFMPTVVDYWLNMYDFKKREARLNEYPQFLTNIQGLDIHFIHVKPKLCKDSRIEILPLYLQHGWPGSVAEFHEIAMIDDLKMRLKHTREPQPSLKNESWNYGTNSEFITKVVKYWLSDYDFQKREELLNQYPQFITNIQGLDIHFVHVKPQLPDDSTIEVLPLYIQHGWLGSVVEYFKIIPMLTRADPERDFVFELIIPSLPGFGYSDAPARPGLSTIEIAHIMKNLMTRLGFTKWYTHGGDWGAFITADMATVYPRQHALELVLSAESCILRERGTTSASFISQFLINWQRTRSLIKFGIWLYQSSGFIFIQSTKPDTIGVGFSDSPAGLASYILDKFALSSRTEKLSFGNETTLLEKYTMDELLDNLMLYWAPNKATSAMRHHAEYLSYRNFKNITKTAPVKVPSACTQFPSTLINLPERLLRERFVNMVSFTKMPRGGHFAAMEEPRLLANDIWNAVEKMRKRGSEKKCEDIKTITFSNG